jgi:hypothetical protein
MLMLNRIVSLGVSSSEHRRLEFKLQLACRANDNLKGEF